MASYFLDTFQFTEIQLCLCSLGSLKFFWALLPLSFHNHMNQFPLIVKISLFHIYIYIHPMGSVSLQSPD